MTQETHGLVGMFKGASKVRIDPLRGIIWFIVAAGVLLIFKKAGIQWDHANVAIAIALGLAALTGEYYFSHELARAWHERLAASVAVFGVLWVCAFAYSVNQWIGAASDGQFEKAGLQKAAYTRTVDAASTEKELAAAVERIEQKLKMAPQRTPEAAQADINKAMAHRFWKTTNECRETKGQQTRDFCSAYASAISDKSMATEALVLAEELKLKSAELRQVRAERKNAPVAVSADRTDLRIYTKHLGMSQESAMDAQAVGTIMFISLVLSGLGVLSANREHRGQPKRQWPFIAWVRRVLFGGSKPVAAEGAITAPQAMDTPQANTNLLIERHTITDAFRKDFASAYDRAKAIAKAPDLRAAA